MVQKAAIIAIITDKGITIPFRYQGLFPNHFPNNKNAERITVSWPSSTPRLNIRIEVR